MRVDLENPNPGIFFPWPGAKTDKDGGIELRPLNNATLTEIDRITTTKKRRFRGNAPYDDITVDEDRREGLMWDYCIVSWTNLQDDKGKDISCIKENKVMLMRKDFRFSIFVADCIEQLTEFKENQEEIESKNS